MSEKFGNITGIDVSHHQGVIDWHQVKEDQQKIHFAYIKASQGDVFSDQLFSDYVKGAQAAGIHVGAYHYADLKKGEAEKEAQNFVSKLKQHKLELMPVLDLEQRTDLTPEKIAEWVLQFADHVKKETGEQVMLYTFPAYIREHHGFYERLKDIPLWLAHWEVNEPQIPEQGGWKEITCWQYTDKGTVSGISGKVDMDKVKSLEVLKA